MRIPENTHLLDTRMDTLKLDLWTFDAGAAMADPAACAACVVERVHASWSGGADVVVFPELMWMVLERFVEDPDKPAGVARLFWDTLWPGLMKSLHHPDKAVVLGSVPFLDGGGMLRNRAPILSGGREIYQDKIHLTPWEKAFHGGGPLRIWTYKKFRITTIICLDIEIPELSAALRGGNVDLILVPSATENLLGVERVGRCASARAVELGCHVAVCQLVGRADSELIDENIGRLSLYSPSQSPFAAMDMRDESIVFHEGFHRRSFTLDMAAIAGARALTNETDPSKIRPQAIVVTDLE
jgi:predicted amidohydrolase